MNLLNISHCLQTSTFFLLFLNFLVHSCASFVLDPDETKSIGDLVASRGFILQTYRLLTADDYIVTLHRVVTPDYEPHYYSIFRKPVIIFHGVLTDTAIYFMSSPFANSTHGAPCSDNFGVCLLNTGRYDLWIPNARGNRYSREHLRYTDKDSAFWAYSWEHIALNDLPVFIDYVRKTTGHKKVGYIGYSQGSTTLLALMSARPQYSHIIQPFIMWAPGVFFKHAKTIVRPLLRATRDMLTQFPGEYLPSAGFTNPLLQYPGCHHAIGLPICSAFLQLIFGPTNHLNVTRIPTYFHYVPSAISNWQVAHYAQIGRKGQFTHFDYGTTTANYRAYGTPYAPLWPLWRISPHQKMVVMYGATDWMVDPHDARRLVHTLQSNGLDTEGYMVPSTTWNHLDFFMGQGAGTLLYPEVIKYLDLYLWSL